MSAFVLAEFCARVWMIVKVIELQLFVFYLVYIFVAGLSLFFCGPDFLDQNPCNVHPHPLATSLKHFCFNAIPPGATRMFTTAHNLMPVCFVILMLVMEITRMKTKGLHAVF